MNIREFLTRKRWQISLLVCAAITVSYFDRQTLPVAVRHIANDIPIPDENYAHLGTFFLLTYGLMYVIGGKLIDALGTRLGFLSIMLFWSLACASHGWATSFGMLAASRLLLGVGEGGGFPAATKAVAEWFPVRERSTAMGIINAGTAVGGILAPPLIAAILLSFRWPWVFYFSGAAGLLWVLWWARSYYPPARHPHLSAVERAELEELRTVKAAGRNLDDIAQPGRDARLAVLVPAPAHHRAVVPQREAVISAGGDGHHVGQAGRHVRLALAR